MFRIILKNKFKERKIDLSIATRVMYHQKFTGSIQSEHIKWWKRYWIKPIMLEILYPKKGWITLVKIFREGKPSIRVITVATSSSKRELLVHKQLYGEEVQYEQKRKKKLEQFRNKQKNYAKHLILHRVWNKLSQSDLAKDIGTTFQQIPKK